MLVATPRGANSNQVTTCPAGSYVIVDYAQCQIAGLNAGLEAFSKTPFDHPSFGRGCSIVATNDWVLNLHPTGGTSGDGLLCGSAGLRT